jgi:hypothetical protein
MAGGGELVERIGGQHDEVECLAAGDAGGGIDTAHRLEADRGARLASDGLARGGQPLAGGHR